MSRGGVRQLLLLVHCSSHFGSPSSLVAGLRTLNRLNMICPTPDAHLYPRMVPLSALPHSLVDLELGVGFCVSQPPRIALCLPRLNRLCLHQPMVFPSNWGSSLPSTLNDLSVEVRTPNLETFLRALPCAGLSSLRLVVCLSAFDKDSMPPDFSSFPRGLTELQMSYRNGEVLAQIEVVGCAEDAKALQSELSRASLSCSVSPGSCSPTAEPRFRRRGALKPSDPPFAVPRPRSPAQPGDSAELVRHLPPNLTCLHFPLGQMSTGSELHWPYMPTGLTTLDLASSTLWLEHRDVQILPRALTCLSGVLSFIQPSAYSALPPHLSELFISSTRRPDAHELLQLPFHLKSLKLGSIFAAHLCLLPASLTFLDCPVDFDPLDSDEEAEPAHQIRYFEAIQLQDRSALDRVSLNASNGSETSSSSSLASTSDTMTLESVPWASHHTMFPPNLVEWRSGTYPSSWAPFDPALRRFDHGDSETSDTEEDSDGVPGYGASNAGWLKHDTIFPTSLRIMSVTAFTFDALSIFPPRLERLEIQFAPSQFIKKFASLHDAYHWISILPASLHTLNFICPGFEMDQRHMQVIRSLLPPSVELSFPSLGEPALVPVFRGFTSHASDNSLTHLERLNGCSSVSPAVLGALQTS